MAPKWFSHYPICHMIHLEQYSDTFGEKRIPDKINIARDFVKQFRSN
ncbi:hypothetical protein BOVA172_3168 [Bacteroides ovatus]|jgi:hypothetical protein|nr:hypothetical protein BOVAC16_1290 [Bacteroides ovatus]CAG9913872.1 hypothetical protein BOVA172_3168 [Bacteroides ovatus]